MQIPPNTSKRTSTPASPNSTAAASVAALLLGIAAGAVGTLAHVRYERMMLNSRMEGDKALAALKKRKDDEVNQRRDEQHQELLGQLQALREEIGDPNFLKAQLNDLEIFVVPNMGNIQIEENGS